MNRSGNLYAYAPSIIQEHPYANIFYCGNKSSGEIKDYIYMRKIQNPQFYGKYNEQWGNNIFISESSVLAPTPNTWDSKHVCDPSVLKGSFGLNGTNYNYALFYTGSQDPSNNGFENQVGVAFSNNLTTWIKYPHPIVKKNCSSCWGVGQPSATSTDGQGQVLLFMTRGTSNHTGMKAVHLNLSNLYSHSTSVPVVKSEWSLPISGLNLNIGGNVPSLNGGELIYNISQDKFYMIWGSKYNNNSPSWISKEITVSRINGGNLWAGSGSWEKVNSYSYYNKKSFDPGFARNPYGNTIYNNLSIGVSSANETSWPQALYSYHLQFKALVIGD